MPIQFTDMRDVRKFRRSAVLAFNGSLELVNAHIGHVGTRPRRQSPRALLAQMSDARQPTVWPKGKGICWSVSSATAAFCTESSPAVADGDEGADAHRNGGRQLKVWS